MARQDTATNQSQNQQNQEQQLSRSRQPQYGLSRGFGLSPGEFFRANPFSLMRRMSEEMDRVFSDFGGWGGREGRGWAPAVEVSERDGNYLISAELPGLKPEDVKLEITDDSIILQGERRSEHEEEKGGVKMTERHYGEFYRVVPLPEGAKGEDAKAHFENGVLRVTVPLEQPRSKSRQIPIQSGSKAGAQSETQAGSQTGQQSGTNKAA